MLLRRACAVFMHHVPSRWLLKAVAQAQMDRDSEKRKKRYRRFRVCANRRLVVKQLDADLAAVPYFCQWYIACPYINLTSLAALL